MWNWEQPNWPSFVYESKTLEPFEIAFRQLSGESWGAFKHISDDEKDALKVTLISEEAFKTSEIEGELLNRESIQSSICKQFGLSTPPNRQIGPAESGVSSMMVDLYKDFDAKISHDKLFLWHTLLMNGRTDIDPVGAYRSSEDPMQIVSGRIDRPKIHFQAPPAKHVTQEMDTFVNWFNSPSSGSASLIHAGLAHLYFVCIHPFMDGNGRIARALSEISLAQSLGHPTLIALAQTIESDRNAYYTHLEDNNKELEVTDWLLYFSKTIIKAQENTKKQIEFIIAKTKLYDSLKGALNSRQKKALERLFKSGPEGFKGGLSAKNYIAITQAPKTTATRDLNDLVSKGALTKTGQLKHTRYYLNV